MADYEGPNRAGCGCPTSINTPTNRRVCTSVDQSLRIQSTMQGASKIWILSALLTLAAAILLLGVGDAAAQADMKPFVTTWRVDAAGGNITIHFNGDISAWDTSSVTSMRGMFLQSHFNGDISSWDTSSVIDMPLLFADAVSFNGDISTWDVSSVESMVGMFRSTASFNQNLGGWYVTINNTSIERANIPGTVGTISAQNAYLDGQNPTYAIIPGGDSDRFKITDGNQLIMVSAAADQELYTVIISATGDLVFENGNNWQDIQVTLKDGSRDFPLPPTSHGHPLPEAASAT